jgi:hypothetical protein
MNKTLSVILIILTLILLSIPIYFYYLNFGLGFWKTSTQWAELGSFFGGVLGPLLSFISIIILWISLKSSDKSNREQINYIALTSFENSFYSSLNLVHEQSKRVLAKVELHGSGAYEETCLSSIEGANKSSERDAEPLWKWCKNYFETVYQAIELVDRANELFSNGLKYNSLLKA